MIETSEIGERDEYERLLHFLRRPGPRFGFALARYIDPAVARSLWERAIVDLAASGQHAGLLELHHYDDQRDLVQTMVDAIEGDADITLDVLFVVGMDRLIQDAAGRNRTTASITNLNLRRDELPDLLGARVVWWLPHASYPAFATLLRDIDEVLLTAFEFVAKSQTHLPPNPPDYLPGWMSFADMQSIDGIQNQARLLAALHDRAEIGEQASLAAAIANLHLSVPDAYAACLWFDRAAQEFEQAGHQADAGHQRRRLAAALLFFGEVDRAEAEAWRAMELARATGIDHELAESFDVLVDIHISRGNAHEAILLLEKDYLPLVERLGDARLLVASSCKLADALFMHGDIDRAMHVLENHALPAVERLGDEHGRAFVLGRIADILEQRGDLDTALRIRREGELPIFERLGDIHARAITLGKIADILVARGDLEQAQRIHLEDELPIYERLGDVRARAVTLGRMADIHATQGEIEIALTLRSEQLAIYDRIGDPRGQAQVLGQLASFSTQRGMLDEAENILQLRVIPLYERIDDRHALAIALGRLATIRRLRGRTAEAREILETRVLPEFESIGDLRSIVGTLGGLAGISASEGDYEGALRTRREKQLPIAERVGDLRVLATVHHHIATLLIKQDAVDEAIAVLRNECFPRVEQLGDIRKRAAMIGTLADALRAKGEIEEALTLRRDEELPTYEALGETREVAMTRWGIAYLLKLRDNPRDHEEIIRLLESAHADALRLDIPEAISLAEILTMERTKQKNRVWMVLRENE
jgi:tetratricopeptide (TPR) repeat protein